MPRPRPASFDIRSLSSQTLDGAVITGAAVAGGLLFSPVNMSAVQDRRFSALHKSRGTTSRRESYDSGYFTIKDGPPTVDYHKDGMKRRETVQSFTEVNLNIFDLADTIMQVSSVAADISKGSAKIVRAAGRKTARGAKRLVRRGPKRSGSYVALERLDSKRLD